VNKSIYRAVGEDEYVEIMETKQFSFMNKEDFYTHILEIREVLSDPKATQCTCPKTACEWHGKCKECVAFHRHYKNHIPTCLQPIIDEKINALAGIAEMTTQKKPYTPEEYWHYVKERDDEQAKNDLIDTRD